MWRLALQFCVYLHYCVRSPICLANRNYKSEFNPVLLIFRKNSRVTNPSLAHIDK